LRPWWDHHGDEQPVLVNMYGITETTVHVTYRPLSRADLSGSAAPVIGGPVPGWELYILDENGEPVPAGIAGEIYVGGAGLARGYWKRQELTAERFVPDPFSGRHGARLYRSGDLARRRNNGEIEYLGRIDHQVKVRGFRIELGEIESALQQCESVAEAVVLAVDESSGDKRLVAYLRPRADAAPDFGAAEQKAYEPPRTSTEQGLAGIWAEVLGIERVGLHDDFFELGGHSLLVTQVIRKVREQFGVDVELRALFFQSTLAAFASEIDAQKQRGLKAAGLAKIPRTDRTQPLELSFSQQRLWFVDQLEPGSPAYNIPVAVRLRGRLDLAGNRSETCSAADAL
jgi:acyl-CoA synthetase (AMP-forming)/AMP-acid ligase II